MGQMISQMTEQTTENIEGQMISEMTEQTTASMTEAGTSDFLGGYTATGGNANRKFSLSGLANYFLNKFKMTLGGSSQTVKSAIDALNSNSVKVLSSQNITGAQVGRGDQQRPFDINVEDSSGNRYAFAVNSNGLSLSEKLSGGSWTGKWGANIGNTSISGIGDGSVTGAISALNGNLSRFKVLRDNVSQAGSYTFTLEDGSVYLLVASHSSGGVQANIFTVFGNIIQSVQLSAGSYVDSMSIDGLNLTIVLGYAHIVSLVRL